MTYTRCRLLIGTDKGYWVCTSRTYSIQSFVNGPQGRHDVRARLTTRRRKIAEYQAGLEDHRYAMFLLAIYRRRLRSPTPPQAQRVIWSLSQKRTPELHRCPDASHSSCTVSTKSPILNDQGSSRPVCAKQYFVPDDLASVSPLDVGS